jgi:hypothetical protein
MLNPWQIATKSATPEAGAPADCAPNARAAFASILELGASDEGRGRLQQLFRLCDPLGDRQDAIDLAYWAQVWRGCAAARPETPHAFSSRWNERPGRDCKVYLHGLNKPPVLLCSSHTEASNASTGFPSL